ncbi:MAG: ATP phosphoribosyltransferase regulatory subunit [Clostridia bacterium]|jgi:ATP phosphoribosyltransferase regulatory subunit|nr:ATP phosphoribosyltransferase regulatory subunit [Clostridia bacterium]MDH7573663.1 ATP phosphoribosyltransferase regulatory subunit [Clostridia bacterium]
MSTELFCRLPAGMRDCLPPEAERRRRLTQLLADLFDRWAYQEILTPTLERQEVFAEEGRRVFQFADEGELVVLRPEITAAVARVVATYYRDAPRPLRFFYAGNVFRRDPPQAGRLREFGQAGVELLGVRNPWADAEVIALAIEALRESGLKEFRLGMGQVQVTLGMLKELGLSPEAEEELKQALAARDYVALETSASRYRVVDKVEALMALRGGREVLERARSLAASSEARFGLEGLAQVWEALEAAGLAEYLFLDLALLRDFQYYTGVVFEGYAAGLGFPVLGGGRYDQLLYRYGLDLPATGFALGLERLLSALPEAAGPGPQDQAVLVAGRRLDLVLARAQELRREGRRVEMDLEHRTREEAEAYAAGRGRLPLEWVG